jgi:hypothetical protein
MPASPNPKSFECPVCGADVPVRASACPECGADERTGWNEEATRYDGLDLPNAESERDGATREPSVLSKIKPKGMSVFWWVVGIFMLIVFVYEAIRSGR